MEGWSADQVQRMVAGEAELWGKPFLGKYPLPRFTGKELLTWARQLEESEDLMITGDELLLEAAALTYRDTPYNVWVKRHTLLQSPLDCCAITDERSWNFEAWPMQKPIPKAALSPELLDAILMRLQVILKGYKQRRATDLAETLVSTLLIQDVMVPWIVENNVKVKDMWSNEYTLDVCTAFPLAAPYASNKSLEVKDPLVRQNFCYTMLIGCGTKDATAGLFRTAKQALNLMPHVFNTPMCPLGLGRKVRKIVTSPMVAYVASHGGKDFHLEMKIGMLDCESINKPFTLLRPPGKFTLRLAKFSNAKRGIQLDATDIEFISILRGAAFTVSD